MRPLTLLVGENNSGKSYLATLIWGLFNAPAQSYEQPEHPAWQSARGSFSQAIEAWRAGGDEQLLILPGPLQPILQESARALKAEALRRCVAWAFQGEVPYSHLEVAESVQEFRAKRLPGDGANTMYLAQFHRYSHGFSTPTPEQALPWALACSVGIFHWQPVRGSLPRAAYLPAARTGYLHLLPELIVRLLEVRTGGGASDGLLRDLPLAIVHFLQGLVRNPGLQRHEDLAALVEEQVLGGRVSQRAPGSFVYRPAQSPVELPAGRSSALVTELLPFVMMLRQGVAPVLIFEEPEAHLHPRLQRVVARALVNLVRRGHRVVITTHSDTLVQQFNNFLKLGALGPGGAERLAAATGESAYGPDEHLLPSEVGAYEFRFREDGMSVVEPLDVRADGATMPAFNAELDRLQTEVLALNQLLEG